MKREISVYTDKCLEDLENISNHLKLRMKSMEGMAFLKLIYSIIKTQGTMEICWGSVTGLC